MEEIQTVGKESGIELKKKYVENKAQDKIRISNLEKTVYTRNGRESWPVSWLRCEECVCTDVTFKP